MSNDLTKKILCPNCAYEQNRIVQTMKADGKVIRWRKCFKCENTFKTYESIVKATQKYKPSKTDGILCPECGSPNSAVTNSRTKNWKTIRYRKCEECGHNYRTEEKSDMIALFYIKTSSKKIEPFFLLTLLTNMTDSKNFEKRKDESSIVVEIIKKYISQHKDELEFKDSLPVFLNEQAFNIIVAAICSINEIRAVIYYNLSYYNPRQKRKKSLASYFSKNEKLIKEVQQAKQSVMRKNKKG